MEEFSCSEIKLVEEYCKGSISELIRTMNEMPADLFESYYARIKSAQVLFHWGNHITSYTDSETNGFRFFISSDYTYYNGLAGLRAIATIPKVVKALTGVNFVSGRFRIRDINPDEHGNDSTRIFSSYLFDDYFSLSGNRSWEIYYKDLNKELYRKCGKFVDLYE